MKKLMKIPAYVSFLGILASFALIMIEPYVGNMAVLVVGAILLHLFGWLLAIQFFLGGAGFLSTQLGKD